MTQTKQRKKLAFAIGISFFLIYVSTAYSSNNEDKEKGKNKTNASIELGAPDYLSSYDMNAKKIMSKDVVDENDNKLGTIQDLLLKNNDEVAYAVVSLGGIFAVEESQVSNKLIAIPFNKFRMKETEMEFILNIPKKQLEQSPGFQYGNTLKYDMNIAKIIDLKVVGEDGDRLGTIEDLILSNDDKVEYAIISIGGILGLGSKLVAAPFYALEINIAEEKVILPVTEKQLKQAPEFQFREP